MAKEIFLSFMEHMEELRRCLIKSFGAIVLTFAVSYFFADELFLFMVAPLKQILQPGQSLIGTGVAEAFFSEIKVALVAGAFLACPVIFYQIWRFIAPGLHGREKRLVIPFVITTSLFFVGGSYFCYRVVLPFTFLYFIGQYQSMGVAPEIRMTEYFSFFFRMILAFGIAFELPIFTYFLVRLGIWDYRFLWRQFRYAILIIFILAAILTPGPDVISQILLAGPLTVLYLLSIGVAYIMRRRD
ncbi:MAG: twin-arginine translocase subunit TatC [Candidatus Binatia bacterium]